MSKALSGVLQRNKPMMNKTLSGVLQRNKPMMNKALSGVLQRKTTTSWAVTGLGVVVTGVGKAVGGPLGAGIMGFGMAHVALGLLDMFRPTVRY